MRALSALALSVGLVAGCGGKKKDDLTQTPAIEDPAELAAAARARPIPEHMRANYDLKIDAPTFGVTANISGGLVVSQPDRFRIEIYAPLIGPRAYLAANGAAVNMYIVPQKTFYTGDDAESVLRELTVGAAGLDDVVSLLVGRLPFDDAEVTGIDKDADSATYTFAGPNGSSTDVEIDNRDLTPMRVVATSGKGIEVLNVEYADYQRQDRSLLPGEIVIAVPGLDMRVEMDFKKWEVLEEPPDVYDLSAPRMSQRKDLMETLAQWGESAQAPPDSDGDEPDTGEEGAEPAEEDSAAPVEQVPAAPEEDTAGQ